MTDVIQYLPHYREALKEAHRVLRAGSGSPVCNFANTDWLLYGEEYLRIRKKIALPIRENFFAFKDMVTILRDAGFEVADYRGAECFRYYEPYHRYEMMLARVVPWMHRHMKKVLFKCRKS